MGSQWVVQGGAALVELLDDTALLDVLDEEMLLDELESLELALLNSPPVLLDDDESGKADED